MSGAPAARGAVTPADGSAVSDSTSAHQAADRFLAAFDSLRWDRFTSFLAEDVTMFFPFADRPSRVDGRTAVQDAFEPFFASARDGGVTSLGIVPRAMRLQMVGNDVAVVSFELGAPAAPARRSIILSREAGGNWKVVHWHASPAPAPPPGD